MMATNIKQLTLAVAMIVFVAVSSHAQRKITPVDNPQLKSIVADKPTSTDEEQSNRPENVVEQTDLQGRIVLVDTVTGKEYTDTILLVSPKRIYPLFDGVMVGVNFWDAAARIFGQEHGLGSVWAEVSFHNWLKPYVEFGLGSADHTPSNDAFRYKSPIAPFFKVGMNYNFLYNSNPHYSVYAGLRFGYSAFKFEVLDGSTTSGYWDETRPVNVPTQSTTALYGELLAGVRVYIIADIYLGWEIKMHTMLSEKKLEGGQPWYIPGYGTRSTPFSAAFSVSYKLPVKKKKTAPSADDK